MSPSADSQSRKIAKIVENPWVRLQEPESTIYKSFVGSGATEAYMRTLSSVFPWTKDQLDALRLCRELHGRVGIVEGPPGSGKTYVLAAMATFYAAAGCCVFLFAPSTSAAEALSAALEEVMKLFRVQGPSGINLLKPTKLYGNTDDIQSYKQGVLSVCRTSMVVTTPNAICAEDISNSVGANHERIIVIHDDSHLILESETLATAFGLLHSAKVNGLVLSGDVREWPLAVATKVDPQDGRRKKAFKAHYRSYHDDDDYDILDSDYESEKDYGCNEFADQVGLPLITRFLRQRFPCVRLQEQHRMRPALTTFAIDRIYKSLLTSSSVTYSRPTNELFMNAFRKWLELSNHECEKVAEKDLSVVFLDSIEGEIVKERETTESKRNEHNARVVCDLLETVLKASAIPSSDIVVITPYRDQVKYYQQCFTARASEVGLKIEDFPKVTTFDNFRGKEARVVILDLVVTCADNKHGMGIVGDECRSNLACTRARDTLIMVGSMRMTGDFARKWEETQRSEARQNNTPVKPLPYFVQYAKMLNEQGLVFYDPGVKYKSISYKVPEGVKRQILKGDTWTRSEYNTAGYDRNIERDGTVTHLRMEARGRRR